VALGISSVHRWRGVCIIDTVAIELLFVSNCYCNGATRACHWATCKIPASQQNRQVRDVALAASGMDTFPLHAVFSTHSLGNTANSHVDCSATVNNPFFFIDTFINNTLGCNADSGLCTGISQCLVNPSKHSSGWYSTVRKTLLIFCYGLYWITFTTTVLTYLLHGAESFLSSWLACS